MSGPKPYYIRLPRSRKRSNVTLPRLSPNLPEVFGHFFVEPLIHVASVLGGLLSQEVIKAMGCYDAVLNPTDG